MTFPSLELRSRRKRQRADLYLLEVTGFVDQTLINIEAADYGGEMDPHGADLRGNPLG